MRFQEWLSGVESVQIGLWIGQHMPRWAGYGLSRAVADAIAWRKPRVYRVVRANLRQVVGPEVGDAALGKMVHHVFEHAGQTYYDFFRAIGKPREVLAQAVRVSPSLIELVRSEMTAGRGVLFLGIHMSSFDLGLMTIAAHGFEALLLSLVGPNKGFEILNDLRTVEGFEVLPITPRSLRAAIRRLKQGGMVMTGADRPVPGNTQLVEFCGRPAYLPLGPARLARMTGATVVLGVCYRDPDQGYILDATGPIEMVRTGKRREDVLANTRRLAEVMEAHVRAHPEQWMMFHPVWPESTEG